MIDISIHWNIVYFFFLDSLKFLLILTLVVHLIMCGCVVLLGGFVLVLVCQEEGMDGGEVRAVGQPRSYRN